MKFTNVIALALIGLLCLKFAVATDEALKKSKGEYKLLFVYYNTSNKDPSHPLNKFDYKNIILNNDQVVVFISNTPSVSTDDNDYETSNYLYTMKYINIDLPCLGKSYLCTHSEFVKEYKHRYPEIVTVVSYIFKVRFPKTFKKKWVMQEKPQNNASSLLEVHSLMSINLFGYAMKICKFYMTSKTN